MRTIPWRSHHSFPVALSPGDEADRDTVTKVELRCRYDAIFEKRCSGVLDAVAQRVPRGEIKKFQWNQC